MSDDLNDDYGYDDGDDTDEQPAQPAKEPNWRRKLESKARTEKERADKLERENAFLKAGVNPEDPKAKWLVKGYDGELTADAVKAAATEAGLLAPAESAEADDIPAEERQAHERMTSTAAGAGSNNQSDAFDAAIADAKSKGQTQRVIELKQQQAATARAQVR